MLRFASIQLASNQGERREERFTRAERYLQNLYEQPLRPQQVLFPEIWATGFFAFDDYVVQAEAERGDTYDFMSAWARKLGCYIHTGSFVEKEGEQYYNTSLLLDPAGRVAAKYRKLHLFTFKSREPEILTPGSQITVADTEYGRVGLSACYDIRFPELYRAMVNLGAEYFLVTSAWGMARLEHWKLFNRARAIENQCFVVSCDGAGTINGSQLAGHSMAVDPWGEVIAMAGGEEEMLCFTLDPEKIRENRANFPALRDKRLI